jgi:hypothetical protein
MWRDIHFLVLHQTDLARHSAECNMRESLSGPYMVAEAVLQSAHRKRARKEPEFFQLASAEQPSPQFARLQPAGFFHLF